MNSSDLPKSQAPGILSSIGGAAQGGSAKPREEREQMDRENEHRQKEEESPSGAGGSKGKVGGNSNDSRTDEERSSGSRED